MSSKKILFILLITIFCSLNAVSYQMPKVLFLTTGDGNGRGTVSDGIVIANEFFNKAGAFVRLENRKILYNPEKLAEFSIMILPTTFGYHDGDRKYSLSYLSEFEMKNISNWVKNGGTLISDVYLGRNKLDGNDRISKNGDFSANNWLLSKCFGVQMVEKNMKNFAVKSSSMIWKDEIIDKFKKDEWTPVITKITSNQAETLAFWSDEKNQFPAIVKNDFHDGHTILLGNFNIIHPAIDGGFSNTREIQDFYNYVLNLAANNRKFNFKINPWKEDYEAALALSFISDKNQEQSERILNYLEENNLSATFFINRALNTKILKKLQDNEHFEIASHSFEHKDFRKLSYPKTVTQILENETFAQTKMNGFRFPLTNNSFFGMKILAENNYLYDSSIGINHLQFYRGSIFPYNISVFRNNSYHTLDLLEISPNLHNDWFYLKNINSKNISQEQISKEIKKYDYYLKKLWERTIRPNHGLMVFSGQPQFSGKNQNSMSPLKNIVEKAKSDDAWITNLEAIAKWRNNLRDLNIYVNENQNRVNISFNLKNNKLIHKLSLRSEQKPKKIEFEKNYELVEKNGEYFIILEKVSSGDKLIINF